MTTLNPTLAAPRHAGRPDPTGREPWPSLAMLAWSSAVRRSPDWPPRCRSLFPRSPASAVHAADLRGAAGRCRPRAVRGRSVDGSVPGRQDWPASRGSPAGLRVRRGQGDHGLPHRVHHRGRGRWLAVQPRATTDGSSTQYGEMFLGTLIIYACRGARPDAGPGRRDLAQGLECGLYPFVVTDTIKVLAAAGLLPLAWKLVDKVEHDLMRVHIGCDHAGLETKKFLVGRTDRAWPRGRRPRAVRVRRPRRLPTVLPARPAPASSPTRGASGIVLGGSGNGEQIAANKVDGVRAALVWSDEIATLAREHNDANVVSIGARMHSDAEVLSFVEVFLATPFSGDERHIRRIGQLAEYERTGEVPPTG